MFFDITSKYDYDKDIMPFIKNGIIIDTSIIKIVIDGLVSTRISKKKLKDIPEYKSLLDFLEIIKVSNRWDKFYITPHILTEVCTHLRNDYGKQCNYKEIVGEVFPLLEDMGEQLVIKKEIIANINFNNPIIEIGDISIMLVAEDFVKSFKKTAILAKDRDLNKKYEFNPNVMIMDYESTILNLL